MKLRDRIKELKRVRAGDLRPNPKNWRTHPEAQKNALRSVLAEVGIADALLARETPEGLMLLDGHLRAETDPDTLWPVLVLDVTEEEGDKLLATVDPIAGMAEVDRDKLTALINEIDIESEELERLLTELTENGAAAPEVVQNEVPEPPKVPVTQPGDLWLLGDHRLLCGDSTKAEDVGRVMQGERAALCFTSPPYAQQRDYTPESKGQDWDTLMRGVFGNLPMADDGQVLVNLGLVHRDGEWVPYWDGWIEWMRAQGWRRFGWYVWDQGSGLPGDWNGRLAPSHEFMFHFNRDAVRPDKTVAKKPDSGPMGSNLRSTDGRNAEPSSVCEDPNKIPDSVLRVNRNSSHGTGHPATFPVPLAGEVLKAWPGLAYEPFAGSGTTLIAAEQLGRRAYGIEISPAYCDVIVQRWEKLTGKKAKRERVSRVPEAQGTAAANGGTTGRGKRSARKPSGTKK